MVSRVHTIGLNGLEGYTVEVEADVSRSSGDGSAAKFGIVGLPDNAVREAQERVKTALRNSRLGVDGLNITLNLAPADVKKEGSVYDLAMALSILVSAGEIPAISGKACFTGELSLSGQVRACSGVLASAIVAKQLGYEEIYVPSDNASEAAAVDGITVYGVSELRSVVEHMKGKETLAQTPRTYATESKHPEIDFADVIGQQTAKRACEIAAAGGHNMLFIGPPGTGKSMLAKALAGILPDMSKSEILQSSRIYSVAGKLNKEKPLITSRPFVKTNQSVSVPAMTGGGANPAPGLISLAHNGVLFLDEIAEFPPKVLDCLRQPLEDNSISVSRVRATVTYPAGFMLVCAMNPCPCGKYGNPNLKCTCTKSQVDKYMHRISGPLLDRIDLQVELPMIPIKELHTGAKAESSAEIKKRVDTAREIQRQRYGEFGINCNAKLTPALIREICQKRLTADAQTLLDGVFEKGFMSMRSYDKILRIAQTISDLEGSDGISKTNVSEALFFRSLDKKYFNK